MQRFNRLGLLFSTLMIVNAAFAADEAPLKLNCDEPLRAVPDAMKKTLGALYHGSPAREQLIAASVDLEKLASATTFCRIRAQSPAAGGTRELAWEWITLYQWVNRIADFVYLNGQGRDTVDWKLEYADFATLYEFEA